MGIVIEVGVPLLVAAVLFIVLLRRFPAQQATSDRPPGLRALTLSLVVGAWVALLLGWLGDLSIATSLVVALASSVTVTAILFAPRRFARPQK